MSWVSSWWRAFWKKGITISHSGNWPDDKNLPEWTGEYKRKSKKEIMREIAEKNKRNAAKRLIAVLLCALIVNGCSAYDWLKYGDKGAPSTKEKKR